MIPPFEFPTLTPGSGRRRAFPLPLIFVTLLYLAALAWIVLTPVESGYVGFPDPGREAIVSIDCLRARGSHEDYRVVVGSGPDGPRTFYCDYPLSRFRALFPEYHDMSDRRLVALLDQQVGMRPRQLPSLLDIALFRLIVRFPLSMPMLIGGVFLARAIVKTARRSRSLA